MPSEVWPFVPVIPSPRSGWSLPYVDITGSTFSTIPSMLTVAADGIILPQFYSVEGGYAATENPCLQHRAGFAIR